MSRKCKGKGYSMNNPKKSKVKKNIKKMMSNDDRKIRRAKRGKLA